MKNCTDELVKPNLIKSGNDLERHILQQFSWICLLFTEAVAILIKSKQRNLTDYARLFIPFYLPYNSLFYAA